MLNSRSVGVIQMHTCPSFSAVRHSTRGKPTTDEGRSSKMAAIMHVLIEYANVVLVVVRMRESRTTSFGMV